MRFKRASLYIQSKNTCTLATLKNIVRTQYWIIMNDTLWAKLIITAENIWIWSRKSGAIFRFIYNWFTGWFYKQYNTEVEVKAVEIMSDEFETMIKEWYSFGLWLQYASNWYKQVRKDWEITLKEVKKFNLDQNNRYWHNHTYKHEYIIESLDIEDKTIKFSLKALREAVSMWIYWKTARTIIIKDKLVNYYALQLNMWTKYWNVDTFTTKNRIAIDKAMELRILRK